MPAGKPHQGRVQQFSERLPDSLDREKLVTFTPENDGGYAARAQSLADISGLAGIEVACGADQLEPSLRALIRREHFPERSGLREPPSEHREEAVGIGRIPGLNARDRVHGPLGSVHAIENGETADALRRIGDHQLRGRRSYVVSNDDRARHTQSIEELEHPSRLARHVDTQAGGSRGVTVTDEIRYEDAIPGAHELRRDVRPQAARRWKSVQQKKRGAFAVLFEAHADVADLNRVGHRWGILLAQARNRLPLLLWVAVVCRLIGFGTNY